MDRHRRRAGELFIEIHPEDARTRGVATGDAVRVRNGRGEVRAVCSVSDRVRPGVAWMPFGGFMDAGGKRLSVNVLTPEEPTDWGGGSGLYDAFVEVTANVTAGRRSSSERSHSRASRGDWHRRPKRPASFLRRRSMPPRVRRRPRCRCSPVDASGVCRASFST